MTRKDLAFFVLLAVVLHTAYASDPDSAIAPQYCEIIESIDPGICESENAYSVAQCEKQCRSSAGPHFMKAECKPAGPQNVKYCSCFTNCSVGSAYGDPRFKTYDGIKFEFHGACKYLLTKTIGFRNWYPDFVVHMRNLQWDSEDITVPGAVTVEFPQLALVIEIDGNIKINNKTVALPFEFTKQETRRFYQLQISAAILPTKYNPHATVQIFTISSNFGVTLINEISPEIRSRANGVYVYIANHPIFLGHTRGILGLFDLDPRNDFIDNYGKTLNPDSKLDQFNYGDTFCVDQNETTPDYIKINNLRAHNVRLLACQENAAKSAAVDRYCNQQLRGNKQLFECLGEKKLDEAVTECASDTCYAKSSDEEATAACNIIEAYSRQCGVIFRCV